MCKVIAIGLISLLPTIALASNQDANDKSIDSEKISKNSINYQELSLNHLRTIRRHRIHSETNRRAVKSQQRNDDPFSEAAHLIFDD